MDKLADIPVFIHKGEIVFVEDKDHLLESHRIVKGGKKYLMKENKSLFINLDVTDYSFTGVINQVDSSKKSIPDMVQERLNVEYLMMAYTERRQ